jgi:2-polyprenyl-6-hydroxyphenyl methylase/3-demethylubiquinone-9 3-methyltransferase
MMENFFDQKAEDWWEETGPFKLLHRVNPLRLEYILKQTGERKKLEILDFGCGGGLVTIPLARLGHKVTGLDSSEKSLEIARAETKKHELKVDYFSLELEAFQKINKKKFDLITSFEVLEHLTDYKLTLVRLARLLKPGGLLIISTINRNPLSYLGAIFLAERVFNWVPRGTHKWNDFIKPSEVKAAAEAASLELLDLTGLFLNPFTQDWSFSDKVSINYLMAFRAPIE